MEDALANTEKMPLPFLKWAGGKRWLAQTLNLPPARRYIEPFLGGGAIFFSANPTRAVLSDVNAELIETYRCVRDNPEGIAAALKQHAALHSTAHYYSTRAITPSAPLDIASRFIYLNRTCWNGLYRVNKRGEFNVPIGTKDSVLLSTDDWAKCSEILSKATIFCRDFEESIADADEGDVVFADPPYTVKHNLNGFVKYNESIFSWDDQIRLCDALAAAAGRGAKIVLTNAAHNSIRSLYAGLFKIRSVSRSSVLAGTASARGFYDELLITANI